MALTHCQSADGISRQIHLCNLLCMLDADILEDCTLIDSKQQLVLIDGIFQTVQPIHLCLTTLQPANGTVHRILHIFSVCKAWRTLIKCHGNGRSQIGLDLHTLFRTHENLSSIDM